VLRLSGHGEHDDASYVADEMKQQPFARDCLKVAEQTILESNLLDPDTLAEWRKDAVAQVDKAVAAAQKKRCRKPTKKIGARYPYVIFSTTRKRMNDEEKIEMKRRLGDQSRLARSSHPLQRFNHLTTAKR
jgi:TPP-dependent pyruvate/acetoin dehydrogenase alpha subunit